ncbi:unnamed protein product [Prunus armeniaca]
MSRARRCARISIWISLESRTDIAYRVFSGFARFGPLDGSCRIRRIVKRSPGYSGNANPGVKVLVTVRSCDRERSDRPIWTKLAGRAS